MINNYKNIELQFRDKMKNISKLLLLAFIISVFGAEMNAQSTQKYYTKKFSRVAVSNQLTVSLVNSDSCYIIIDTDDFNPEKFSYSINDGTISFDVSGANNFSLEMEIGSPAFEGIYMEGASDLHSKSLLNGEALHLELSGASSAILELNYNILTAKLSGASDAKIDGKVDSIYVNTSGASDFNSFNTATILASVKASGASDVKINPDSTVIADVTGTSSLRYKKDPAYKSIGENKSVYVGTDQHSVYVSEDEDTIRIMIGGSDTEIIINDNGNPQIKRTKKKRSKFRGNWAGVEFGVNGYLNSSQSLDMPVGYEFMELKYEKSTNFNLNFFQQSFGIFGNKFGIVTGLGLRWNNYRFDNNIVLNADSSSFYGYHDQDKEKSYEKSKLTAWYLTLPILFEFQTNRWHNASSFHLSAGVIGGIRMGSHSKQVYTVNGSGDHKPKVFDDFHLQPFILDATVRIGWGPLNLYATYSVIEMFRNNRGPELYPFSTGLILPF